MKNLRPFVLQFYTLIKICVLFFIFLGALTTYLYYSSIQTTHSLFLIFVLISIFMLFIGVYEYKIISRCFLSIKINRQQFFINSILLGLLVTIINVLIFYFILKLLQIGSTFPLYIIITIFFYSLFNIGCFYSIYFDNFKNLKSLITLIVIIVVIYNYQEIIAFCLDYIKNFTPIPIDIYISSSLILIANVILTFLVSLKLKE